MSEPAGTQAQGQRRPTAEDIPGVLEAVSEGKSLRHACREAGLHCPSTHSFIHSDEGLREQYARALELRADCQQEEALEVARAAATGAPLSVDGEYRKIDAAGARVLLDAIKWSSARMAPKTAPIQRIEHLGEIGARTDEEIAARIAALEAQAQAEN